MGKQSHLKRMVPQLNPVKSNRPDADKAFSFKPTGSNSTLKTPFKNTAAHKMEQLFPAEFYKKGWRTHMINVLLIIT